MTQIRTAVCQIDSLVEFLDPNPKAHQEACKKLAKDFYQLWEKRFVEPLTLSPVSGQKRSDVSLFLNEETSRLELRLPAEGDRSATTLEIIFERTPVGENSVHAATVTFFEPSRSREKVSLHFDRSSQTLVTSEGHNPLDEISDRFATFVRGAFEGKRLDIVRYR